MKENNSIKNFLSAFHLSNDVETVFTQGCCYWFAWILHTRFPESRIMYDEVYGHFVTEINGRLYDITGDVTDTYSATPWDEMPDDDPHKHRIIRDCIQF